MPELPEVETITRQLEKSAAGKKIKTIEVFLPKIIKVLPKEFENAVVGSVIKKIWRRAKLLIFELNNGYSFIVHLKLTGQLIFQESKTKNQKSWKYTHVIFNFTDDSRLLFNDLRQFGYIKLLKTECLDELFRKEGFGPEPLKNDFTLKVFREILERKPRVKIKQFLMDQKNIAGSGNIYSDEILFSAGVHPLRQNKTLKTEEIKKIYKSIGAILAKAVKLRGTSADTYLDARGQEGKFLKQLKVYGLEGKNCVKCKGRIKRIKIGGRSAHFCSLCQK